MGLRRYKSRRLGDTSVEGDDILLLDMAGGEDERSQLIEEQSKDASLRILKSGPKRVLLHRRWLVSPYLAEKVHKRILVPSSRRSELLLSWQNNCTLQQEVHIVLHACRYERPLQN